MNTERLTTIDEHGSRRFVIPAEVTGRFRTWRNRVNFVLILVFLGLPWLKINGLQTILIDIPNRHFEILGKVFLAHDSPLLFLIVALGVMSLAFVTAIWGRVWCGWACPQTVFIDGLYRKLEIWIEGDYKTRRRLQAGGLSFERLYKSTTKWFAFFLVSSIISHSFIAYFTGSTHLLEMIQGSPEQNWTYFLLVSSITSLLLFNFGWFREQFCTIMCPYGRFQSVLMDNKSLTVLYDEVRGEPRKGTARNATTRGDCISCNRCVEVCPAKIDIRQGVQIECISCTACIDACNEIMKRVNKPENLIRYANVEGTPVQIWRPRTLAYLAIMAVCSLLLAANFVNREPYSVTLLRAKDAPYQVLNDGMILNHMKAHLFNQSQTEQEVVIQLDQESESQGAKITQAKEANIIPPGRKIEVHFFVSFPKRILNAQGESGIEFLLTDRRTGYTQKKESTVVGPQN